MVIPTIRASMISRSLAAKGYIAAVHALLVLAIIKGGLIEKASMKLGLSEPPEPNPWVTWLQDEHRLLDASIPEGEVVFFGDSITDGLVTEAIAPPSVNYAINGQRSDQLLSAMDIYGSLARARAVVLTIGTNDLLQGRAGGIRARYDAILAKIPSHLPVVVSSVPPSLRGDARPLVDAARAACAARSNCTFVDAFAALSALPDALQPDGVHLSGAGYAAWVPLLRQGIAAATARKTD